MRSVHLHSPAASMHRRLWLCPILSYIFFIHKSTFVWLIALLHTFMVLRSLLKRVILVSYKLGLIFVILTMHSVGTSTLYSPSYVQRSGKLPKN